MGAEYYLKNDDLREYFISLPPIVQDQIKAELRMGREMDESFPS